MRMISVNGIEKTPNLIDEVNVCVFGFDEFKNGFRKTRQKVDDIARECSRYTIPEADEICISFSGERYFSEGPPVNRYIGWAVVGYYTDENISVSDFNLSGTEPSGLSLLQESGPIFVMKRYPCGDSALPDDIKKMFIHSWEYEIDFEGRGKGKTSLFECAKRFAGLCSDDTPADNAAKRDFWKKFEELGFPESSVVVCETELDFGKGSRKDRKDDMIIRGRTEIEVYLPLKDTVVSRILPDDEVKEVNVVPYVRYDAKYLDGGISRYWGGGQCYSPLHWGEK